MTFDVAAARARCDAATPGPWQWGGHDNQPGGIDLISKVSGWPTVMGFQRWGMQGAEPCFWLRKPKDDPGWGPATFQRARDIAIRERHYRSDVVALANPDAEFIAHARTDLPAALDEIERLKSLRSDLEPGTAPAIIQAMFDQAHRLGHSPYSAKHALTFLVETIEQGRAEIERLRGIVAALAEDDDDELDLRFLAHLCRHEDRHELAELGWPEMTTLLDRVEAKYGPWPWEGTAAPEVKG